MRKLTPAHATRSQPYKTTLASALTTKIADAPQSEVEQRLHELWPLNEPMALQSETVEPKSTGRRSGTKGAGCRVVITKLPAWVEKELEAEQRMEVISG